MGKWLHIFVAGDWVMQRCQKSAISSVDWTIKSKRTPRPARLTGLTAKCLLKDRSLMCQLETLSTTGLPLLTLSIGGHIPHTLVELISYRIMVALYIG